MSENFYEDRAAELNEARYFEAPFDEDADFEVAELPEEDGTYRLTATGWKRTEDIYRYGYWVGMTQGDFDPSEAGLGEFVGRWTDPETGTVYIDQSMWVSDFTLALKTGAEYEQLAIWDISAGREIRL